MKTNVKQKSQTVIYENHMTGSFILWQKYTISLRYARKMETNVDFTNFFKTALGNIKMQFMKE